MSSPLGADAKVVVVGASLAGLRAAEEIRHLGHRGSLIVVGEEARPPYDRPPLSKQVLAGKWGPDRIEHHSGDAAGALGLDLRLGRRAVSLDVAARRVVVDDGTVLAYDGLVIATGVRPRRIPSTDGMAGVHVLRTLDDCLSLRRSFEAAGPAGRVVVVGGGFIGAEAAATLHGLGARVTVVEALPVPLTSAIGPEMGAVCAGLHADAGVEVVTGVGVSGIDRAGHRSDGELRGKTLGPMTVRLGDGRTVDADVVLVGIGVAPATDWLEGSGLDIVDGVRCDERLFAHPGVVAAGDVARWHHRALDAEIRIEHWTNASEGGAAAGRSLVAGGQAADPFCPVPFFWSDQYGTKIQVLGRPSVGDEVVVVEGSTDDRRFVALYRRGDRLGAVLAMSRPKQLMGYRPLLEAGASFDEALDHARS